MIAEFFWTPDSERLAFIVSPAGGLAYQHQLFTIPASGGRPRSRTAKTDLAAGALFQVNSRAARVINKTIIAADGASVYLSAAVVGQAQIFNVALLDRERCQGIVAGERLNMLLAVQDHNIPPEVMPVDLQSGKEKS